MELGSRDPISVVSGLPSPPQVLTGSGSLMWPQDTRGEPLPSIVVVLVGPLCFCSVLGKSLILLFSSSLQSVFFLLRYTFLTTARLILIKVILIPSHLLIM